MVVKMYIRPSDNLPVSYDKSTVIVLVKAKGL